MHAVFGGRVLYSHHQTPEPHESAVSAAIAVECLNQAYHPEMLNRCALMLGMQGDESAQLRIWLQQWYGINDLDRSDRT